MHSVEEIKNGVYWMGCNDFLTPLFERIFPIPDGVSYNSFFIDDEKTCVLDAMDKLKNIRMSKLSVRHRPLSSSNNFTVKIIRQII